jgi:nicotinamide-nucleotide amidase
MPSMRYQPNDPVSAAARVLDTIRTKRLSIVMAESCTAGMLTTILSDAPGAAKHFHGGFVTYTKESKVRILGVPQGLLTAKSAVCPEVAVAMAEVALERSPADLAVAITGVAGPERTKTAIRLVGSA